jgi:hypothetical protein
MINTHPEAGLAHRILNGVQARLLAYRFGLTYVYNAIFTGQGWHGRYEGRYARFA